ncbi:hypothetical protein ACGF1Z_10625 [Streptomyces sp. NPDC048018]|uniref:hypothetical protein n=1 Tax=Streptomyces sp. NPDC048018 TaxID=3365499 RepID=UPI0037132C45
MGDGVHGRPYEWGRLHAAFRVLEGLAAGTSALDRESARRATTSSPRNSVERLLRHAAEHILRARERGGERAVAAARVYGDIGLLIAPEPMSRGNLGPREVASFDEGYEQQLGVYREAFGALVV